MSIVKHMAKRVRYFAMYIKTFHKFNKVGKNTVIYKPLRIMNGKNVTIGDFCYIIDGLRIETYESFNGKEFNPKVVIGDRVNIGQDCQISASNTVIIEDDVTFGPHVMINDTAHGYADIGVPIERQDLSSKPITIGAGSLLGYGVVVLPGVTIGKNCFIGAYSIIAKDVPDYTVVANHSNLVYKSMIKE